MYIASTVNPLTRSTSDLPVFVLAYRTADGTIQSRKFVARPTLYADLIITAQRTFGFGLTEGTRPVFSTSSLDVCRGASVDIDESAYASLSAVLDEVVVTFTSESQQERSHEEGVQASVSTHHSGTSSFSSAPHRRSYAAPPSVPKHQQGSAPASVPAPHTLRLSNTTKPPGKSRPPKPKLEPGPSPAPAPVVPVQKTEKEERSPAPRTPKGSQFGKQKQRTPAPEPEPEPELPTAEEEKADKAGGHDAGSAAPSENRGPPPGADPQYVSWGNVLYVGRHAERDCVGCGTGSQLWIRIAPDWQKIFKQYDLDHSSYINGTEMRDALIRFGWAQTHRSLSTPILIYCNSNRYNISPALTELMEKCCNSSPSSDTSLKLTVAPLWEDPVPSATARGHGGPPPGISFERFLRACVVVKQLSDAFGRFHPDRDGWIKIDYDQFMQACVCTGCLLL
ncbi:hypothetical protein H0H81_002146 [Sphagnurus paluster]|uniref:EF-hand domain-containing protein n=1 Tax=Sphagnurus paluster TaxID=117069 RepID=A0A9P7FMB5_9AGAR|nr:hypothetical protein H0H81_002146 [Sphagnurus paluster]